MSSSRRALPLLLAAALAGAAARASAPPAAPVSAVPLTVAATLAPQAYLLARLAPAGTTVVAMIPPGSDEETFEPSPSQIGALQASCLYFRVGHAGLPFEARYILPFLAEHPAVRDVSLADLVAAPLDDPHLWMSPALMLAAAERLAAALVELRPADAGGIAARLESLRADVRAVAARLGAAAARSPGAAFLAYHPTYGYLARDFGLRQIGVEVEGKELGLASLVRVALDARAAGARVLFVAPGPAERNGRVLAESIGARVVALDPLAEPWLSTLATFADALAADGGASQEASR